MMGLRNIFARLFISARESLPDRETMRELSAQNEAAANRAQENLMRLLVKTLHAKANG